MSTSTASCLQVRPALWHGRHTHSHAQPCHHLVVAYKLALCIAGEVAGLFAKDEMVAMSSDLRVSFTEARKGVPDTPDNLKQYFFDCVRENLQ